MDLTYQLERAQVGGFNRSWAQKAVWADKKAVGVGSRKAILKGIDIDMGSLEAQLGNKAFSDALKEKLQNAPNSVKKAWNNAVVRLNIADTKAKSGFYRVSDGVHFNLEADAKGRFLSGGTMFEPSHSTVLHELFHNIDNAWMGIGDWYTVPSVAFKSKKHTYTLAQFAKDGTTIQSTEGYTLSQMLIKEGNDRIDSVLAQLKEDAVKKGLGKGAVKKSDAYRVLREELRALDKYAVSDISDMWDGITKGKVNSGFGHPVGYWKTTAVGEEAFAEMGKAIVNHPESLEQIKKYFPKSYEIWLEMIDVLGL
jgi:hypothetical protein